MENRFWRIARRPEGTDFAAALALDAAPLAPLGAGEIRIRNSHLSMDAGTRMWLTDREDGYQPPLPLGIPMSGLVLGEVMESRADGFAPGDERGGDFHAVDIGEPFYRFGAAHSQTDDPDTDGFQFGGGIPAHVEAGWCFFRLQRVAEFFIGDGGGGGIGAPAGGKGSAPQGEVADKLATVG